VTSGEPRPGHAARAGLLVLLLLPSSLLAQPPAQAVLRGRVFERGSVSPVPGAEVVLPDGQTVIADALGRFTVTRPPGPVTLLIHARSYQTLRVTETLRPGRALTVEYRLTPRPGYRPPYSAVVHGDPRREGDRITVSDEELHTQAGSLGDPFRVIGLLPGVATPIGFAPLYVIRGASPGMNGFFLDGMLLPQLFHLLLMGSVIHGALIDYIDFYPGGYDASFGRFAGGIIDAGTRGAHPGYHGQLQLRLFDASGLAEASLPGGVSVVASGRYGYPGPIINAIDNRIHLQYWDYQARVAWRGLSLQALGSYDYLKFELPGLGTTRAPNEFRQTFHRLHLRYRERFGRIELDSGIVGGLDEMNAFGGFGVRQLSLAMRANVHVRWQRFRLFGGADVVLSRFRGENFARAATPEGQPVPGDLSGTPAGMANAREAPDELGDLAGDRDGVVAGVFLQGSLDILPERLTATLGARLDVYRAGQTTLLGIDPRLQLRLRAQDWLTLTAGGGVYQQPPTFPVALPGVQTFALQLGLQRAIHGTTGIEARLPASVTLALKGFYQQYYNANDVLLDFGPLFCTSPPPESLHGSLAYLMRQVDGQSYGMELFVRRTRGRVTGWVAYTLSRSERVYSCGLRPADFDQNHVLNVVAQVRLPWRLLFSARLGFSSGRPATILEPPDGRSTIRNNTRLPDYVQLDLRLDREWTFSRFTIGAFIELLNATYSTAVFGLTYPEEEVMDPVSGRRLRITRYDQPQILGSPWILPSVGVKAGF
jgi:hypothetical protein